MCSVRLVVDEEDQEKTNFIPGMIKMDTESQPSKYVVMKDSPTLIQINQHEIRMKLIFKRRLTSETIKAFLPSLLLICCSYATSYFRLPNFFNAAIGANLTVLLTMNTMISKQIAETSYIKWIEIWLLFGTFVPFVQVILITVIEWLRNKEEMEQKEERKESREEVGFAKSTELYEMSVGGRNIKVKHLTILHVYL